MVCQCLRGCTSSASSARPLRHSDTMLHLQCLQWRDNLLPIETRPHGQGILDLLSEMGRIRLQKVGLFALVAISNLGPKFSTVQLSMCCRARYRYRSFPLSMCCRAPQLTWGTHSCVAHPWGTELRVCLCLSLPAFVILHER